MGTTEDTENTAVLNRPGLLYEELTARVRQTAFDVHRYFGNGFLEKVYESAMANRLRKQGLEVVVQTPLAVRDEDGTIVGQYVADLVVDGKVLVEIKAASGLAPQHQAQVLNYLKVTGLCVGLLLSFGLPRLQVKRLVLST